MFVSSELSFVNRREVDDIINLSVAFLAKVLGKSCEEVRLLDTLDLFYELDWRTSVGSQSKENKQFLIAAMTKVMVLVGLWVLDISNPEFALHLIVMDPLVRNTFFFFFVF